MMAVAEVRNLNTQKGKHVIVRNLNRILNIRILDIDIENSTIYFLYAHQHTLQKVRKELSRLGYPVISCRFSDAPRTSSENAVNATPFS